MTRRLALVLLCCLGSVALAGDDSKDDGHAVPGHHIETIGGVADPVGNGTIASAIVYDFLEDTKDVLYGGVAIGFAF